MTTVWVMRFDERYEQSITVGVFSSVEAAKDFAEKHSDEVAKSLISTDTKFTAPWVDVEYGDEMGAIRKSSDDYTQIDIVPYHVNPVDLEDSW